MKAPGPIYVTDLFPKVDAKLIELLKGLSSDDWHKPTVCAQWDVKDIAAHLLDTTLRRVSVYRDNYFGEKADNITSYKDLVDYLNRLNADWVRAARRLSPPILIALSEQAGRELSEVIKTVDPHERARHSVAWAGEEESENWFDIAREYTEKWHHQQQIRLAVNKPGIMGRELYFPVLDTFMRALPFTYRNVDAQEGTLLSFEVTGEAGGRWYLLRRGQAWQLLEEADGEAGSEVTLGQGIAWRLFTKGIDKEAARREISIAGDSRLGSEIINMLSVMA